MTSFPPKHIPEYRSLHSHVLPLSGQGYGELMTQLAALGGNYYLYARFEKLREREVLDPAQLEYLWEQGGDITDFVSARITDPVLMLVEDDDEFTRTPWGASQVQFFAVPEAVALETAFGN